MLIFNKVVVILKLNIILFTHISGRGREFIKDFFNIIIILFFLIYSTLKGARVRRLNIMNNC